MPDETTTTPTKTPSQSQTSPTSTSTTHSTPSPKTDVTTTTITAVVAEPVRPIGAPVTSTRPRTEPPRAAEEPEQDSARKSGAARGKVRAATDEAASVVSRAIDGAGELLHDARDKLGASYERLEHQAVALEHRVEHAVERTVAVVERRGSSMLRFASAHALPLLLIGTGVGLLTMSMRRERERALPRQPEVTRIRPGRAPRYLPRDELARDGVYRDDESLRSESFSGVTTAGEKPLGVRVADAEYPRR